MPLRFLYTINEKGSEYRDALDEAAPSMTYEIMRKTAPEAVILDALKTTYPVPSTSMKVLLAVPEDMRHSKKDMVEAIHRLASAGLIDFQGQVHENLDR